MRPAMRDYLSDRDRRSRLAGEAAARADRWRRGAAATGVRDMLDAMGGDWPRDVAAFGARIAAWVDDAGWVEDFVAEGLGAMRADPMADIACRMQAQGGAQSLALVEARHGNALLGIVDAARAKPSPAVLIEEGYSAIRVLRAGGLTVRRHVLHPDSDRLQKGAEQQLADGDLLLLDTANEQIAMTRADSDVLLLCIAVSPRLGGRLAREYDCASGQPLRVACADPVASRLLALLALTAQSDRDDAADSLAALTGHPLPLLRWQAARYLAASEPVRALPVIHRLAREDADPGVRAAAGATAALFDRLAAKGEV